MPLLARDVENGRGKADSYSHQEHPHLQAHMDSLVLELQRDATSPNIKVVDLLRKALLVASKLGIEEFERWATKELSGYGPDDELPEYRIVYGQPYAKTNRGLQHLVFPVDFQEMMSKAHLRHQSVAEIEDLAASPNNFIHLSFPPAITQHLIGQFGYYNAYPILACSKSSLLGVLSAIRDSVLKWSLQLEKDDILGEGMTFSKEEKQKAEQGNYHTSNFFNYGHMYNSQIQQATEWSMQSISVSHDVVQAIEEFLTGLKERILDVGLPEQEREEAEAEIATIETQLASPKPKRSIIRESLLSIRRISEGAAGKLLASGLEEKWSLILELLTKDITGPI